MLSEIGDGFGEWQSQFDHDEVDGIEVLLALEAAPEVGSRVDSGIEVGAKGAEEAHVAVADLPGYAEVSYDRGGFDVVSQRAELFCGDALSHRSFSRQRPLRGERFGARVSQSSKKSFSSIWVRSRSQATMRSSPASVMSTR